MSAAILQSPWLEQLGWTLLHFLWQGSLVAAVLAAVLAGLRDHAARTRYLVSVVGALAAGGLPLATFLLLPLPPAAGPAPAPFRGKPALPAAPASLPPTFNPAPAFAGPPPARQPAAAPAPTPSRVAPALRRIYGAFAARARPSLPWLAAAWALGVAGLSCRLLTGWTQVQRLRRRGVSPVDASWQARLQTLAARLGVRRAVRLLESTLAEVPAVVGWLRPVILLPVGMLAGLSTAQVEMILAHELAHVRRQDYVVNLGLALFETLGFYHPAVWWIARCVRAEREHVCDDLAVAVGGGDRLGYARALATLEEMRGPAGRFALAAGGTGRGLLLARVRRLLGVSAERPPRAGRATWCLAGVIALLSALAVTVGGVQRPARAQEASPGKSPAAHERLRGQVVDANGQPVAGALVYDEAANDNADPGLQAPVLTSADGSFEVPRLRDPGQWRVIAARRGDEAVGWLDIARRPAAVGGDNRITQPIVLRARQYRVSGVCVDEQSRPFAGARVAVTNLPVEGSGGFTLTPARPEKTITQFWEALVTRSDAQGAFSLAVPVESGLSLEISAPGRQTVHPFAHVSAGQAETGDLGRFTLAPAGSIAGRVAFADGSGGKRSLQGMVFNAVEAGELQKASVLGPPQHTNEVDSDAAGNFRIEGLPPGTYSVFLFVIEGVGYTETPTTVVAAENVVVRAGEPTPLDLLATVGRHLEVQAFNADTNQPLGGGPFVHFEGPSRPRSAGRSQSTALDEQGKWDFEVAPGHYRVFLTRSFARDSPELASAEVDVPADRAPEPVRLAVKETQLRLRGRVQDAQGKPVPLGGASTVMLFLTDPKGKYPLGGSQSSAGTFQVPYPQAGVRARLAVDVAGYGPILTPEFALTDRPEPVTVTLEPAAAMTVRGRAVDRDGQPVARAQVIGIVSVGEDMTYQERLGSGVPDRELFTGEDGRFETHRFRAGDRFHLIVATAGGVVAESAPWVQLAPGTSEPVEVELHPPKPAAPPFAEAPVGPRDLAGHVVDARDQPIEGALITVEGVYPKLAPATTDAQGRFRFADFGDRHYLVLVAEKTGLGTCVVPDLTVGRDFAVRMEDSTRLRGKLLRPDGAPAGAATITLFADKTTRRPDMEVSGYRQDHRTNEDGTYDFPVEPGEYRVEVRADHENLVARHEKFAVPADRATALPEALQPGLTLRIQTVDSATGQPAPGARFYIRENKGVAMTGARPGSEKQTDAQGFARWDGLLPGRVILDVDRGSPFGRLWSTDERELFHEQAPASAHPTGTQGVNLSLFIDVLPPRSGEPVLIRTERGVKVSGLVLDPDGKPVEGTALVAVGINPDKEVSSPGSVRGLVGLSSRTAADGTFQGWIPASNGARCCLVAEKKSDTLGDGLSESFASAPGDERKVTIHLTTGGWIEGSVVDKNDQPLADISVAFNVVDRLDGGYKGSPQFKTDAQGHFRLGPLRPAAYDVRSWNREVSYSDEPPEEIRRVIVPAGGTVQAGPLHFEPAGWTAPSPPPAKPSAGPDVQPVTGQVVDAQGKGVPDAEVFDCNDRFEPPVRTDAAGTFRLPPGVRHHQLAAHLGDRAIGWPAMAGTGAPTITLRARTATLDGEIVDDAGQPVEGARVQISTLVDGLTGSQTNRDNDPDADAERFWSLLAATSDARGRFRLPLPEGAARSFEVTHPRHGKQWFHELPADGHLGRVVLAPGGSVSGRVLLSPENTPLADASVWVCKANPDGENGYSYGSARTAADGSYLVSGLEVGEYTVVLGWRWPRPRPRTAVAAEHVPVRAGETTTGTDLRAVTGRTVTVETVDAATGKPRTDAEVACFGPSEPRAATGTRVTVDRDGRWQFVVAPGTYDCRVLSPLGNERSRQTVEVSADPAVPVPTVRLAVGTDTRFRGTVQRKDGGPVPAGTVIDLVWPPDERESRFHSTRTTSSRDNSLTFVYDGLTPGNHVTVVVDAPGCRPWHSEELTVAPGLPEIRATLEPAAVAPLRGSVMDPAGNPAAGATVRAMIATDGGGQLPLALGPDGTELRTDARGRFETRRLRVGDSFRLWAHDEHDAHGNLLLKDDPAADRRQVTGEPLTIRDAGGLEAPVLRLAAEAPVARSKHSGTLEDPYTAEDRAQQLQALAALASVDDPHAAPMLQIVFMSLNEHAPGQPPDAAEQAVLARFLDATNPDVLAPASKAFRMVNDPATLAKLKAAVPRLAARPDDALWLAERLHLAGSDDSFDWIAARLRDPATLATQRRVWSFQLLPVAPRWFAPLYVDLLADGDPAVRANALGRLSALTDGEDLGFDPARGPGEQAAPLGRWRDWLATSGGTLPERSQPPRPPPAPSAGWLGLALGEQSDGSGLRVFAAVRGGPAQRAGVRALDVVIAVDGRPTLGRTSADVIARQLAGAVGAPVKLTIQRANKPDPQEITVVRAARPAPTPPPVRPEDVSMQTNEPVPPPSNPPPPTARTLVFRVAERGTNRPVPDAGLRILEGGSDEKPARTDAAGACVIPLPETPRSLSVRVRKPGFVPMRVDWSFNQPAFHLPAEYTMTLEPGTTIGGIVLNEDGAPVADAAVVLILRGSNSGGTEEVFPDIWEERVRTDAQGKWTYDAAPSVLRYPSITVEHPDYVRYDHHTAVPPTVENLRDRSFVVRLRRGVRVEGRVIDPAGRPIANATVLPGEDRMDSTTKPEYHTDADGRFVIAHTLAGAVTLTVKAEGHAPETVDTVFPQGTEGLSITLQPGRVLRLRVVDAGGKGLAGVMAAADTWRRRRTLETCLESDADGRIEWKSAPPDAVQYDILKEGYQSARGVALTATGEEQTITLRRPLVVSGAVTDAHTGQPVRGFQVIPGVVTADDHRLWSRDSARPGSDGRYVQAFDEPAALGGQHLLHVEADGYRSAVSRRINDAEGRVTLDFSLEPGSGLVGRVLAPDGQPAAGAKIAVVFPGAPASVQDGVLDRYDYGVAATADAQGQFGFPTQEPPYQIVVTHPAGFARVTAEEFAAHPDVGLTAWGRVEAAVPPMAPPAPGHPLSLYLTDRRPDGSGRTDEPPAVYFDSKARLSEDGASVSFDHVPPGDWWLGRYGQATVYARPVRVAAGETARLSLVDERTVTGRLNTAAVPGNVDLTSCKVQVSLKQPAPPVPEGLAGAERQAWFKEWFNTDAGKTYQAAARTYHGEMTEAGVFRCEGVPSGKEYELSILLLEPGPDPLQPRPVLYAVKTFDLAGGKEADDLGEVQSQYPAAQSK